jgi:hypothetical protein
MSSATTPTRAEPEQRRVDIRMSPSEYRRLERSARDHLRSVVSEARHLILRGLDAERPRGERGA